MAGVQSYYSFYTHSTHAQLLAQLPVLILQCALLRIAGDSREFFINTMLALILEPAPKLLQ